jgi:hypothetical protein
MAMEIAMEHRGLSLAAAMDEYKEFAAGYGMDEVREQRRAERAEAAANAAAQAEVESLMRGMSFRSG